LVLRPALKTSICLCSITEKNKPPMEAAALFQYANLLALLGWLLLLLSPYLKPARQIAQKGLVPVLLGLAYLYLIVVYFGQADGGFSSLEEVKRLFSNDHAVLAGWVHYLAFDLWVGSWELEDSKKYGIPFWAVIPCLFLTFMLGPIGLLAYLALRGILAKKLDHDNFQLAAPDPSR
jgi:hypothetical protein